MPTPTSRPASRATEQARAPLLPQVKVEGLYERTTGNRRAEARAHQRLSRTAGHLQLVRRPASRQLSWSGTSARRPTAGAPPRRAPSRWATRERATRLQAIARRSRTAYFRARAQKALVGVARETLANQERHLEQITRLRPRRDAARDRSRAGARRRGQRARAADPGRERLRRRARRAEPGDGRRPATPTTTSPTTRFPPVARRGRPGRAAHRRGDPRPPRSGGAGRADPRAGADARAPRAAATGRR